MTDGLFVKCRPLGNSGRAELARIDALPRVEDSSEGAETVKSDALAGPQQLDLRRVALPWRNALTFDAFARLAIGQAIVLVNDHDPRPLAYQLQALNPGQLDWEYTHSRPHLWHLRITRNNAGAVVDAASR